MKLRKGESQSLIRAARGKGNPRKYLIYKDYETGKHHLGYDYMTINATDDLEALTLAEAAYNAEADRLYRVRLMRQVGKVGKDACGMKTQDFESVLCKRSKAVGWHKNDEEHAENPQFARRHYKPCKYGTEGELAYVEML